MARPTPIIITDFVKFGFFLKSFVILNLTAAVTNSDGPIK